MTFLAAWITPPRARASLLVFALLAACGGSSTGESDGGIDAALDAAGEHDAATDAPGDDGPDGDGGCPFCVYGFCPDTPLCSAAVPLEPGAPLTMQDTESGGRGDCATSASGWGGPNLYYTVTLPAGQWTHIVATPTGPTQDALVRVLPDCLATATETSARGGGSTSGVAALCVRNETTADRTVVVAVGRYSGETMNLTLQFDLSVEILDPDLGCPP